MKYAISLPHLLPVRTLLAACLIAGTSGTNTRAADIPPSAAPNSAASHVPHDEHALIKKHNLSKLKEKLSTDEATLKVHCRFESDIAQPPPDKLVALTFDDGPEPGQTEFILDLLKKYQIPATFFMIGEKAQAHPDLVRLVQDSSYGVIGSHSWSHPNFHEIPVSEQAAEITKSQQALTSANSHQLFRYPYGNSSCESNALLKTMDQHIVGWHVDSCDWAFDHKGSVDLKEALSCGVLPQNRNDYKEHVLAAVQGRHGGIILMHEIHPNTLRQLEDIIIRLQADGYQFRSMADPEFTPYLR